MQVNSDIWDTNSFGALLWFSGYNFLYKNAETSQVQSLPVVAAARQAAGDAGASESGGAGVVAHVVPLSGAHATAFHVAAAHTEAQACEAAHARSVAKAGIVEPRLRHWGRVWVEKEKGGFYLFMKRTGKKDKETNSR